MLGDRIEGKGIDAFVRVFELCDRYAEIVRRFLAELPEAPE